MDTSTDENLMKIACESNLLWSQWTKKLGKISFFIKASKASQSYFPVTLIVDIFSK